MLVSGIIVLAALCGFALGAGDPTIEVNIEKVSIVNVENPIMGEWSASVKPGKPQNKLMLKTPTKTDLPADLKIKFNIKINGSPLPEVNVPACNALEDEIIGKGVAAAGKPFPQKCPILKDNYLVVDWEPEPQRMPPGLPDGKLDVVVEIFMPGKKPFVIINVEGTIKHNLPGMG